jgi:hypothetical protein
VKAANVIQGYIAAFSALALLKTKSLDRLPRKVREDRQSGGRSVAHWSRIAVQGDATCKTRYQALRKVGHTHGRALRRVGDRLLEISCAMMRSRSLCDPQRTARELHAA